MHEKFMTKWRTCNGKTVRLTVESDRHVCNYRPLQNPSRDLGFVNLLVWSAMDFGAIGFHYRMIDAASVSTVLRIDSISSKWD